MISRQMEWNTGAALPISFLRKIDHRDRDKLHRHIVRLDGMGREGYTVRTTIEKRFQLQLWYQRKASFNN